MGNELFGGRDVGNTPSFKEQAYALIKDAILFNRFRVGAIYSQEAICTELGISRTPVREALLELQKDGYVSFCRGKGVQVVPVSWRQRLQSPENQPALRHLPVLPACPHRRGCHRRKPGWPGHRCHALHPAALPPQQAHGHRKSILGQGRGEDGDIPHLFCTKF